MSDSGISPDASVRTEKTADAPPQPPEVRPVPLRIFLVRHGQSTWNESGRIQGQLDPPLSPLGHEQAARLASRFAGRNWAGFYSSDLRRAVETASPLGAAMGREPTMSPDLREIFLGEWEGLSREEVVERHPREWELWTSRPSYDDVPGGEGAAAFEARVERVLDRIIAAHEVGDVLVVTHGGVIQVALGRIIGRSSHGFFPFLTENTSVSVLHRSRSRFVIASVNDTCHLH